MAYKNTKKGVSPRFGLATPPAALRLPDALNLQGNQQQTTNED
jgi:hypothetical protein